MYVEHLGHTRDSCIQMEETGDGVKSMQHNGSGIVGILFYKKKGKPYWYQSGKANQTADVDISC